MSPEITALLYIVALWLIAGLCLWGASKLPLDGTVYNIIRVLVIVVGGILTILWILRLFGLPR
jgi:hypothetical protein